MQRASMWARRLLQAARSPGAARPQAPWVLGLGLLAALATLGGFGGRYPVLRGGGMYREEAAAVPRAAEAAAALAASGRCYQLEQACLHGSGLVLHSHPPGQPLPVLDPG